MTFGILARFFSFPVVLGVFPMLVIMLFLPKQGLRTIFLWSLPFALFSFGWWLASAYLFEDPSRPFSAQIRERTVPSISKKQEDEINRFFVSDKIDPNIEFDIIEDVKIGELTVRLPVLKNSSFKTTEEIHEDGSYTHNVFFEGNDFSMIGFSFEDIVLDDYKAISSKMVSTRRYLYYHHKTRYYSDGIIEMLRYRGVAEPIVLSQILQNSPNAIIVSSVFSLLLNDDQHGEFKVKIGVANGGLIIKNAYTSFLGISFFPNTSDYESLSTTWIDRFISENL